MLRKGYVLLRRVFLFKHFTQIPRPKWPGDARARTHPAPSPLPSSRPPPQGPSPRDSRKLPAAAAAPVIPVACPEARRAGAGTTGGGASPQPGPPTGRSARREGGGERGTPGRGSLRLLIPLKVADQRRQRGGRGGAGGGGRLARAATSPLRRGRGSPA